MLQPSDLERIRREVFAKSNESKSDLVNLECKRTTIVANQLEKNPNSKSHVQVFRLSEVLPESRWPDHESPELKVSPNNLARSRILMRFITLRSSNDKHQ